MEIIMHGDPIGGNATSMGSPSNARDVGHDDPFPQGSGGLQRSPEPERDTYMLLGGGMTLLAGILAIINGLSGLFTDSHLALGPDSSFTRYTFCGMLVAFFGIVATAGGISAMRGKNFTLALVGAVMGMLGSGLLGFFLGLGALVVFALSSEDLSS